LVSVDKISSDHKCVRCRQVQFLRSTSVSPNCRAQSHPLVWWVIAEVWQLVVCLISLSSLFTFPFGFRFYHYYVNSVQNCLASYKKWLKWLCIPIVCRETIKDWSN
jgi:hypothetical protein